MEAAWKKKVFCRIRVAVAVVAVSVVGSALRGGAVEPPRACIAAVGNSRKAMEMGMMIWIWMCAGKEGLEEGMGFDGPVPG
jgi:hypothetical protein